jgi:hypothetical protein
MSAHEFDIRSALEHPYPGLRSFEVPESFLFFGRQTHTNELLRRLSTNRMLAVIGTSGSGKSSLVRAGLLPALQRGYLGGAGSRWRFAIMRPGRMPLDELVNALAAQELFEEKDRPFVQKTVEQTTMGLAQTVRLSNLQEGESLLLVVDQFEELFRFRHEREDDDGTSDATVFVAALLETVDQIALPIYVVLTMRSDFLGDCVQFAGLAEALNGSQYLVTPLIREQRQEAIEGPMRVAGARMSQRLVQRLLNDVGEDPDQLPVLQHALMATFREWKEQGGQDEIDLLHYERVGRIADALNQHVESVYRRLSTDDQYWTQRIFRCLTTMQGGRAVRRPARLERIMSVVGAAGEASREEQIRRIIKQFAAPENNFLILTGSKLMPDTVVDISHESLIRKWTTLDGWVRKEAESEDWYRYLLRDAKRHQTGTAGLWRDPDLKHALRCRSVDGWNEAWAAQYASGYDQVNIFLNKSRSVQRRWRFFITALAGLMVMYPVGTYLMYRQQVERNEHVMVQTRAERAKSEDRLYQAQLRMSELQLALASARDLKGRRELEAKLKLRQDELAKAQADADKTRKLLAAQAKYEAPGDNHVQLATAQIDNLQGKLDETRAKLNALQTPVVKVSPPNGTVFNNYPRATELVWLEVASAKSYNLEHTFLQPGQHCAGYAGRGVQVTGITDARYKFDFVGAQPGCWRVWAVFPDGQEGPKADWWEFVYTR